MRSRKQYLDGAWFARISLAALASLAAVAAWGAQPLDLDGRYPPGSIKTAAAAQQALSDAVAFRDALEAGYKSKSAHCLHVFLQNACQDGARRIYMKGQEQLHRVEVEAHDLQRQLAAQQHTADQKTQEAQWRKQQAERPQKEAEAHKSAEQRSAHAQEQAQEAQQRQDQAEGNRKSYQQRNAEHDKDEADRASVHLRNVAQNEKRFRDKQDSAKSYAQSRQRERDEKRKEREEHEAKLKAQEASLPAGLPDPTPGAPRDRN